MNKVLLIGRIATDITTSQIGEGITKCRFRVAVRKEFKVPEGEPDAYFISCTAFRRTAEMISQYMAKGREIGIEGHIDTRTYEKDGVAQFITDVVVDRFDFIGSKPAGTGNGLPADGGSEDGELPF